MLGQARKAWAALSAIILIGWIDPARAQVASVPMSPDLRNSPWTASWIAYPGDDGRSFGVYYFRRAFDWHGAHESFVIHVSADNRYRLYVNGQRVASGPSRGDLFNWRFETLDLGPYLTDGTNVIAAEVWNFAEHRPMAQHTYRTAFLLQGDTDSERTVDTGPDWRVWKDEGYAPVPIDREALGWAYIVVGPGEQIDGQTYPWGWQETDFDDSSWSESVVVRDAVTQWGENYGEAGGWRLTPRSIPPMEETPTRFASVRRTSGLHVPPAFVEGSVSLEISPRTSASILLDQAHLTTAYPEVLVSGGSGARITVTYAEALFDDEGRKGNRNAIDGKDIRGIRDVFLPDGGPHRLFQPLWFRTYRYVQLDIETADERLTLEDVRGVSTAYPFKEKGRFVSNSDSLAEIWDVGWRTARICAGETYFDCPYYEQLQYVGDTRIQALISLYVAGDDQLMRKAIDSFDHSRLSTGLTQSRYPSHLPQIIPPYSLFWIVMVHDYWMHRDDPAFVESYLTGIRGIVDWYSEHLDETNLIGPTPWWNFVDWSFPRGVPPGGDGGHSSIIALQFVYALQRAAELSEGFGREDEAAHYRILADRVSDAVYRLCWDKDRRLLADTPEKAAFSQHANAMAVLTGVIPPSDQRDVMTRVLTETSLTPCSYYYRFYLDEAAFAAGLGDTYTQRLGPWHEMLKLGLTTFAEEPEPTRSDAHAWSASPNYHFLASVVGVRPASPGFETVTIGPSLGHLEWVRGTIPHPRGEITVELQRAGEGLVGEILLPPDVTGEIRWKGTTHRLEAGTTSLEF